MENTQVKSQIYYCKLLDLWSTRLDNSFFHLSRSQAEYQAE